MMSVEPGRKAVYSKDIAWRVVWHRIAMELPFRKIARNLKLSLGTVHNMYTNGLSKLETYSVTSHSDGNT